MLHKLIMGLMRPSKFLIGANLDIGTVVPISFLLKKFQFWGKITICRVISISVKANAEEKVVIMLKRIGVLTSGGDSPGMNAATRAVVRVAISEGAEVWGIRNGYKGLLEEDLSKLNFRSVGDIIQRGGTFLGTARCNEFKTPEGRAKAVEVLNKYKIEGLVVIGGDGSLRGARQLADLGVAVVGLPGTIDNDIWGTDYTIGFDTACNTILDAINKLKDTASAHSRVIVLEVMGRKSGLLALMTGIAGGAEKILIPEVKFDVNELSNQIKFSHAAGKWYSIIVLAEGAGSAVEIGKVIGEQTGLDTRVSVLGHIQRGGSPTAVDRINASLLGQKAATSILSGITNVMFGYEKGQIVSVDLIDAVRNKKVIDPVLYKLAEILSR